MFGQDLEQFVKSFLSEGVAAVAAKTIAAPLEAVKLRAQLSSPPAPTSVLQMVCDMYQQEGLGVFFAGNIWNSARVFPDQCLSFVYKDSIKTGMQHVFGEDCKTLGRIMAGVVSKGISCLLLFPLEKWRTEELCKQTNSGGGGGGGGSGGGSLSILNTLNNTYSGFGMSLLGIAAYRVAYFSLTHGM